MEFNISDQLPYYLSTKGLAERFVQVTKQALKSTQGKVSLNQCLNTFLLYYRNNGHAMTKVFPATAIFKRQLRTNLDLLKPQKTKHTVQVQQHLQVEQCLKGKHCCFKPWDKVQARNYGQGVKLLPAIVIAQTGPGLCRGNVSLVRKFKCSYVLNNNKKHMFGIYIL